MGNNDNFNFEKYKEMHEGLFRRFMRQLGKLLTQFFKPICTLAAFGIIIQTVGVIDQLTTSDAGKTIEKVYAEAKEAAHETQNLMSAVELSDSLENTSEVMRIRLMQNRILQYYNMYFSLVQQYEEMDMTLQYYDFDQKKIDLLVSTNERFIQISKLFEQITTDVIGMLNTNESDSIFIYSINTAQLIKVKSLQEQGLKNWQDVNYKLTNSSQQRDRKSAIKVMKEMFENENFQHQFKEIKNMNVMLLMVCNQRLLSIKNQDLERRSGYR